MPKAITTEDALAAIHEFRESPQSFDPKRDLGPFLRHKSNHVVAAAAGAAEHLEATVLADLVAAFEKDAGSGQTGPGLQGLPRDRAGADSTGGRGGEGLFRRDPPCPEGGSFGPPVDVAAPLRGLCAQGLARMGHPDALSNA